MPLPICKLGTSSQIPHMKPTSFPLLVSQTLGIEYQSNNVLVIVFTNLIHLLQRSTRLTLIAIAVSVTNPRLSHILPARTARYLIHRTQGLIGTFMKGTAR